MDMLENGSYDSFAVEKNYEIHYSESRKKIPRKVGIAFFSIR